MDYKSENIEVNNVELDYDILKKYRLLLNERRYRIARLLFILISVFFLLYEFVSRYINLFVTCLIIFGFIYLEFLGNLCVKLIFRRKKELYDIEIDKIVDTFLNKEAVDDFSVAVTYDEIKEKKYSLSAGQYFDVKIEYVELSQDEFNARMSAYADKLQEYFTEGDKLKIEIMEQLKKVKYE